MVDKIAGILLFIITVILAVIFSRCTKNPADIGQAAQVLPVAFSSDQDSTQIDVFPLNGNSVDLSRPATSPFCPPAAVALPVGQYVAMAERKGFWSQTKAFVVAPGFPTSVDFRLVQKNNPLPENDLLLFVTFTGATPDSCVIMEWQGEWVTIQRPQVISQTLQIPVAKNCLYYIFAYKFSAPYSQTVFVGEQNVSIDIYLPAEIIRLVFGSSLPATCVLRPVGADTGEVFELGNAVVEKKIERDGLYWASFSAADGKHTAPSQLILADREQVIQPEWQALPQPPDTVQVTVTVRDTVTLRETVTVTVHDTTVVSSPPDTIRLTVVRWDTLRLNDTTYVVIRDTTVLNDTLVVVRWDTLTVTKHDTVFITVRDTVVVRDSVIVYKNFYRTRLLSADLDGEVWVGTKPWNKKISRRFNTLFAGEIFVWGREIRGQNKKDPVQTCESFLCTIRRMDTSEVIGQMESPDTGEGETTRLTARSFVPVPEGTVIEVVWESTSPNMPDPRNYDSVHLPEVVVQNFDPKL